MTEQELIALTPYLKWDEDKKLALRKYFSLLIEWNEKINLTRILEEGEVYEKHFYDSLLIAKSVDCSSKKIADVGTGAGFPGLVLSIFYPESEFTLIEATGKKCDFLKAAINELGLKNVEVIHARAEEYKTREFFDVVTARAVDSLNILLELLTPLCKVGGKVVAMKGSRGHEELAEAKKAISVLKLKLANINEDNLPSGDCRINLFFEKLGKTPLKYPRRYGEIKKSPL